jgi:predicted ATPase with chaperone activity
MLDRFSLLLLCHDWQNREHLRRTRVKAWLKSWSKKEDSKMDLMEIMHWVDQARNFAENTRGQIFANHRLREPQLLKEIEPLVIEKLIPQDGMSLRRRRALLSVARTIADLDGCETMTLEHFEEAAQWTTYPFYALQGFS